MVQGSQGRGQRRLPRLQVRHRQPPRARPPRSGPLPRHQMVHRPGSHRCAATCSAASPAPSPPSTPTCSGPRFALLRRGDTLTAHDRARLDALFDAHPRLKAGWQALQELHGLYTADDYDGALEALGRFCDLYQTGELPEYHDIVDTFIAWSDEILNWHCAGRPSNGRIEGINNLLQVLRRTAHGFTNPRNFEARGILIT